MTQNERERWKRDFNGWLLLIWEDPQWHNSAIKVNLVDNITRSMLLLENYTLFPSDLRTLLVEALQEADRGISSIMQGINQLDHAHQLTVALASEVQQRQNSHLTSAS